MTLSSKGIVALLVGIALSTASCMNAKPKILDGDGSGAPLPGQNAPVSPRYSFSASSATATATGVKAHYSISFSGGNSTAMAGMLKVRSGDAKVLYHAQ